MEKLTANYCYYYVSGAIVVCKKKKRKKKMCLFGLCAADNWSGR